MCNKLGSVRFVIEFLAYAFYIDPVLHALTLQVWTC